MSEEEKKAIEYLKEVKSWWWHNSPDKAYAINLSDIEQFDILLNLIEKQEKVIQGLNKQADELVDDYEKQLQEKNEYIFRLENEISARIEDVNKDYISKDKIREKMEEYHHKDFIKMQVCWKHDDEALKIEKVLKELLEE